jgi:hypothetical protein
MEKTDNMFRYEKAHDDVRKIFESDKSLDERLKPVYEKRGKSKDNSKNGNVYVSQV